MEKGTPPRQSYCRPGIANLRDVWDDGFMTDGVGQGICEAPFVLVLFSLVLPGPNSFFRLLFYFRILNIPSIPQSLRINTSLENSISPGRTW